MNSAKSSATTMLAVLTMRWIVSGKRASGATRKTRPFYKNTFAHHTNMSEKRKIVLDTNCLIASLSRRGQYYPVWKGLQAGEYILCVSTDILEEYAEIITQKTSVEVASNVIHLLLESQYVELVNPYFSLHLIEEDHDDDKFVDCAFAAMPPSLFRTISITMSCKTLTSRSYWY